MSTNLSAKEVEKEYTSKMGRELGRIFNRLRNELIWLHFKWSKYVALFGTSKSRVNLLNVVAPETTRVIQDAVWDDILLHICRLTDDETVGRKHRPTLTVYSLKRRVDPAVQRPLAIALGQLRKSTAPIHDLRNRRLAHNDLNIALKRSRRVSEASRKMIQDSLMMLAQTLNIVDEHYTGIQAIYDPWPRDDGEHLLRMIRRGHRAYVELTKRVGSGKAEPTEWLDDPI